MSLADEMTALCRLAASKPSNREKHVLLPR